MSANAQKFGRNYRLTVDTNDGQASIIINNPLTIKFTLSRSTLASLNTAEIDIYNLGPETRKRIFRDRFNSFLVQNGVRPQKITLEAGYSQLYQVFKGTVFEANSARQGADIVTHISSKDGYQDITNTASFKTLASGTTYAGAISNLQGDYKEITPGETSPDYIYQTFKRPVNLSGNTWDLLRRYTNGQAFVDLEKIHTIKNQEVIVSGLPIIGPGSGLINTPRRSDSALIVNTLFEPRVVMGAQIQLICDVQKEFNGEYKAIGVQHQGTISGGVCENLYSTFTLLSPKVFGQSFKPVNGPSLAANVGKGGTSGAKFYDPTANTTQTNLARTLYGEGASLGPNGMQGIANVIMNRKEAGDFGGTVDGNIFAPGQFSMWNPLTGYAPNSPQNAGILSDYNASVSVDQSNATYAQAYNIAGQALAGNLPDITGGATNYYATSIPAPGWSQGMTLTNQIGNTRFYRP